MKKAQDAAIQILQNLSTDPVVGRDGWEGRLEIISHVTRSIASVVRAENKVLRQQVETLQKEQNDHEKYWKMITADMQPLDAVKKLAEVNQSLRKERDKYKECACAGCVTASGLPELHTCQDGWIKDELQASREREMLLLEALSDIGEMMGKAVDDSQNLHKAVLRARTAIADNRERR